MTDIRFLGGLEALPIRLRYLHLMGEYMLNRERYPL